MNIIISIICMAEGTILPTHTEKKNTFLLNDSTLGKVNSAVDKIAVCKNRGMIIVISSCKIGESSKLAFSFSSSNFTFSLLFIAQTQRYKSMRVLIVSSIIIIMTICVINNWIRNSTVSFKPHRGYRLVEWEHSITNKMFNLYV